MSPENQDKINPQVREVEVGVRSLRKIKIYPLSIADQRRLTDLIQKGILRFSQMGQEIQGSEEKAPVPETEAVMSFIQDLLELLMENVGDLVKMLTDEGEELLASLTNEQLLKVVQIVYEVNFEVLVKNVPSLLERMFGVGEAELEMKESLNLERSSPPSADPTPDTDSNTSTSGDGEKAA